MKRTINYKTLVISLIILMAGILQVAHAQTGVGIEVPNPNEMLDVDGAIHCGTDFNNLTLE